MSFDLGVLVLRAFVGLLVAAHGAQKLFGWFGGYGPVGTGGFMESLGFRPGKTFALLAGTGELVGGLLVALGWATPFGAAAIVAVMVVAILTAHAGKGLFVDKGGFELPLLNAVTVVCLTFIGAGAYSLDAALGWELYGWLWGVLAAALGCLGAVGALVMRGVGHRAEVPVNR